MPKGHKIYTMSEYKTLADRFKEIENKSGVMALMEADEGYYYIKRERNANTNSAMRTFLALMTAIANIVASLYMARACLIKLGLKNAGDILSVIALIVIFEWIALAVVILGMEYDDVIRAKEMNDPRKQQRHNNNKKSGVKLEEVN